MAVTHLHASEQKTFVLSVLAPDLGQATPASENVTSSSETERKAERSLFHRGILPFLRVAQYCTTTRGKLREACLRTGCITRGGPGRFYSLSSCRRRQCAESDQRTQSL